MASDQDDESLMPSFFSDDFRLELGVCFDNKSKENDDTNDETIQKSMFPNWLSEINVLS